MAIFVLSVITDLRVLPTDGALGTDFNDFYVAALAQSRGLNPYDGAVLTRLEARTFGHASFSNTVASPPAFFVAFRPFVWLTPRQGYLIWLALSTVAWLAAVRACAAALGLHGDRLVWMLALGPPTVIAMFLGQISLLLTACYLWAICCVLNRRHALAGLLLALTLVKPHLMIVPVALLCGLTWRSGGRKTAVYTLASALAICALAVPLGEPGALRQWVRALLDYGSRFDRWQPDISSLAGAYLPFMPRTLGRILSALCVLGGLACAAWLLRAGTRDRIVAGDRRWWQLLALGVACWLLVLPYIHPYDDMLLVAPLLVVLALDVPATAVAWQTPVSGYPADSAQSACISPAPRRGAASAHEMRAVSYESNPAPLAPAPRAPTPSTMTSAPSSRTQSACSAMTPQCQVGRAKESQAPYPRSRTPLPRGAALLAILGLLCMPQLDLMGFRPNLTFSYTLLPVLATCCALLPARGRAASGHPGAADEERRVGDQHR